MYVYIYMYFCIALYVLYIQKKKSYVLCELQNVMLIISEYSFIVFYVRFAIEKLVLALTKRRDW